MPNKILSEDQAFIWKTKDNEVRMKSLKDLLDVVLGLEDVEIDDNINANLSKENTRLIDWLEQNFPEEIKFIAELRNSLKEFTPQQLRELIVRELRSVLR
jgi:hypothetical protein